MVVENTGLEETLQLSGGQPGVVEVDHPPGHHGPGETDHGDLAECEGVQAEVSQAGRGQTVDQRGELEVGQVTIPQNRLVNLHVNLGRGILFAPRWFFLG